MYKKLSCISEKHVLETNFSITLKHSHLYNPQLVIDGSQESLLFIMTAKDKRILQPAIWGLLPDQYKRDWSVFQSVSRSLFVDERDIVDDLWWLDALENRRCLIPVTGFYTSMVKGKDTETYHLGLTKNKPFFLAGIYNYTSDGFITCSILLKANSHVLKLFQNVSNSVPAIVDEVFASDWLDKDDFSYGIYQDENMEKKLIATQIPTELFVNHITYDSMLDSSTLKTNDKIISFFYNS